MYQKKGKFVLISHLKVDILRGQNEIGENLIEVSTSRVKVLLECGIALNQTTNTKKLDQQVIDTPYDAIIISHYHIDHAGLLIHPLKALKIYMGKYTYKVLDSCKRIHKDNKSKIYFFEDKTDFFVGDLTITPFLSDHSAYDSYMLALKIGEESILYTGDFRSNGRKNFDYLLSCLPQKVDLLICEATKPTKINLTEAELEEKMVRVFSQYKRVFILKSSQNFDRDVTIFKACRRTGRAYLQHTSCANLTTRLQSIPNPITYFNCYTYLARRTDGDEHIKTKERYKNKLISIKQIVKLNTFVMQITSSMKGYLQRLRELKPDIFNDCALVFSMWQGYKTEMTDFLSMFSDQNILGCIPIIDLHASGHADKVSIKKLIDTIQPKKTIFVHTKGDNDELR